MPKLSFPKYDRPTRLAPPDSTGVFYPEAVTLFSGLGSSSKAARDLGLSTLAHDFLPEACASLLANGFDVIQGDIREVDFTHPRYRRTRLVVGGPPCQPFSQGGRNAGENDPRDMIPDFQRCVAQTLPEVFILENVRGLASPRHKDYLARRVAEFEAIGYVVEVRVLDSADYGVGQSRKRLFVVGVRLDVIDARARALGRAGPDEYPTGYYNHLARKVAWPRKQRRITMADALGWSWPTAVERARQAPVYGTPAWVFQKPSTTVVGSFRPDVQAAPGYRSTGDGPRQNAPGSVVTTQAERLVLQGMPPDWKVEGSRTKRDLQIGNSCPNPLLRALIERNL